MKLCNPAIIRLEILLTEIPKLNTRDNLVLPAAIVHNICILESTNYPDHGR